jgi:two-component system NarL family sensor kinase
VGQLPNKTGTALFRIVQESLANVQKHSGSSSAELWIERRANAVEVRVMDHGRGLPGRHPDDAVKTYGVGIPGMRERAKQLGGQFKITSEGGGTTVNVIVPLSDSSGEEP